MRKLVWPTPLGALSLCACDVPLADRTSAEYPATHDLGMYEVSAAVTRDPPDPHWQRRLEFLPK